MLYRLKNDFRLSIVTLLSGSAILGITPFAIMRFLDGNLLAGFIDLGVLVALAGSLIYAWITHDTYRSGIFLAIVCCSGAVAVGMWVGEVGLFWLYPCLVTTFFLAPSRIAAVLNLVSVLAMMTVESAFTSSVKMWTFFASTTIVSACSYVFAMRNKDQRNRLEQLATIDPLTGVKNRRSMDQELDMAAANAERTGLSYALVILDIDYFKKINDEYGHGVGDNVLRDLVGLIEENTRRTDQLFRFGGEEFVVLFPGLDETNLKTVVANLQQGLRKWLKGPGGPVTSSFGVAMLRHGESVASWLSRADHALYQAKESGRDRVVYGDDF
ncbi:GGDEF domain-containing protein [Marinobacter sp. AL4B]|uniref:GGDEF domain-containing protein n=1 Tax=Marinobacter sp. AL4B TaxID=2871173 RepID=UPI001CAA5840|nr:GGDEF domain-containing protein [Marinobacter sp. AL4B]MBZ0335509.1 GGDEF domain-containing protein [Marinobacter sp. AL4B]